MTLKHRAQKAAASGNINIKDLTRQGVVAGKEGMIMKKATGTNEERPEGPRQGNPWLNIGKLILLIAVLVAAWFVLERLMGGK